MKKIAIYGYGGHAREMALQMNIQDSVMFFVDDEFLSDKTYPISQFNPSKYKMMIGVGDGHLRESMVSKLPKNTEYFTFIHPTAIILDKQSISIGKGSFIGAYSVLTTNIKLGKHSILNRGNHIGHDCNIGNFFSAMPCSVVGGNVTIGDFVYLGSGVHIREKITIGNNITIGMNSAVVKNIITSGTYAGVPTKLIK
jgi:sugar O-acyltransferase (sialic acid O-acetyltransferase NeuD family)